jgi:hypothetical protein
LEHYFFFAPDANFVAGAMTRSPEDLVEIFNALLLGVVIASTVCIVVLYKDQFKNRLGKAAIAALITLFLRILATIRLETTSPAFCSIWVQIRGSTMPYAIAGINFWYFIYSLLPCMQLHRPNPNLYVGLVRTLNPSYES